LTINSLPDVYPYYVWDASIWNISRWILGALQCTSRKLMKILTILFGCCQIIFSRLIICKFIYAHMYLSISFTLFHFCIVYSAKRIAIQSYWLWSRWYCDALRGLAVSLPRNRVFLEFVKTARRRLAYWCDERLEGERRCSVSRLYSYNICALLMNSLGKALFLS
jgi:hypothetical protein